MDGMVYGEHVNGLNLTFDMKVHDELRKELDYVILFF